MATKRNANGIRIAQTTSTSTTSSTTSTTDYEMILDTNYISPQVQLTPVSKINKYQPFKTTKKTAATAPSGADNNKKGNKIIVYERGFEYSVNAVENGIPVVFKICELHEKHQTTVEPECKMHDSLVLSLKHKIIREKNKLICRLCRLVWPNTDLEIVQRHIKAKHLTIVSCNQCGLQFESVHLLNIHELKHTLTVCHGCNTKFAKKNDLEIHLKSSIRCTKYHKLNGAAGKTKKVVFHSKN